MESRLYLGTAVFGNHKALIVPLKSDYIPRTFSGLVDSGSSDCFIDPVFVWKNKLTTQNIESYWHAVQMFRQNK